MTKETIITPKGAQKLVWLGRVTTVARLDTTHMTHRLGGTINPVTAKNWPLVLSNWRPGAVSWREKGQSGAPWRVIDDGTVTRCAFILLG
jgi:hypothetical protein